MDKKELKQRKLAIKFENNSHSECLNYWNFESFFEFFFQQVNCLAISNYCQKRLTDSLQKTHSKHAYQSSSSTTEPGTTKQLSGSIFLWGRCEFPVFNDTSTKMKIDFYVFFAFNQIYTCHFAITIPKPVKRRLLKYQPLPSPSFIYVQLNPSHYNSICLTPFQLVLNALKFLKMIKTKLSLQ